MTDHNLGECLQCHAIFIHDTGKLGGEVLMAGLALLSGNLQDGMALVEGTDYESKLMGYEAENHRMWEEPNAIRYGVPRLWFFRRLPIAQTG